MLLSLSFSVLYFFCFLPESLKVCTAGAITMQDYLYHLCLYLIPISSPSLSLSLMTIHTHTQTHTHTSNRSKNIFPIAPAYWYWNQWERSISSQCTHYHTRRQDLISLISSLTIPNLAELGAQWEAGVGSLAHIAHSSQLPLNSLSAGIPAFLQDKILPLWKAVAPCSWILLLWELYIFIFLSYWAMTHYANSTCFLAVSCC